MSDVFYLFGPYPHQVGISGYENGGLRVFSLTLPPGDTYTHVGDPGLTFRVRKIGGKRRAKEREP